MAEANACGTPVIAFNRGAVPEVVINNKTGYIVDNSAEMILAVDKLDKIKRHDCHEHAKRHFKEARMVKDYEVALQDIIKIHTSKKPSSLFKPQKIAKHIKGLSKRLILKPETIRMTKKSKVNK